MLFQKSKAVILQGKYFYHLVRDGSLAHLPQSSQGTDGIEGLKFCYSLIPRKLKEARYKWITNFYYKLLYTYEETHNSYIEVYNKSTIKKEIKPYLVDFIIYSNKSTIWFTIKTILYVLFPDLFILLINRKK